MGFRRMMWGILFLFTFRINGFDLLPDVIGYFLIFTGLTELQSKSSHFISGRVLAMIAALLSIFTIYQPQTGAAFMPSALGYMIGLVLLIVNAFLFYRICTGVADMARRRGDIRLAEAAMQRWSWFFVLIIINLCVWLFGMFTPIAAFLVIPLFVAMFVVYVLMMTLMSQAERSLG